jgi:hypothetical protein
MTRCLRRLPAAGAASGSSNPSRRQPFASSQVRARAIADELDSATFPFQPSKLGPDE